MQICDLNLKSFKDLVTIGPDASISQAAAVLTSNNIGALLVCDASHELIGILSERDIVQSLSDNPHDMDKLTVDELMTSDVITCSHDDKVEDVLEIVDVQRIRHIPVLTEGRLTTILSSRDVLSALLDATKDRAMNMTLAYEMVR